jgi:hypothetical protein
MGGGSFYGTGDGSGYNRPVTPQRADLQAVTRPMTAREKRDLAWAEDCERERKRVLASRERNLTARRQEQLRLQAIADREKARKIADATDSMIEAEFDLAGMTPEQKAACWMRAVDARRVDLEFAQYLVAEYRAAKTQDALKAREERLKHLRSRHQYCWALVETFCRDENLPDTLESYEQAIRELKLEE